MRAIYQIVSKLTPGPGEHFKCLNSEQFGTANQDQGCFGSAVSWDVSALFKIPDEMSSESAGPMMCGGASRFSIISLFSCWVWRL